MAKPIKNGLLDIFCGAGGLSLGFALEGFKIIYSTDNDKRAIETIRYNHEKMHSARRRKRNCHYTESEDINNLESEKVNKIFHERGYRVQGIIGGPPCQGFSVANKQTRNAENKYNSLIHQYLRLVNDLNPDFIVFENVVGFLSMEGGKFKTEILTALEKLDYASDCMVLESNDYGVPQIRRRVIIIGIQHEKLKDKFYGKISFPPQKSQSITTVGEAISDLPSIEIGENRQIQEYPQNTQISNYAASLRETPEFGIKSTNVLNHVTSINNSLVLERYRHIPQGGNWEDLPDYLMSNYKDKNRCHSYIYRRLEADKPSITVSNFRKCMIIHPTQNRGLSVREAARLQSFPDWYEFKGELMYIQQQVACAVPPLMARAIAKQIKKMLK